VSDVQIVAVTARSRWTISAPPVIRRRRRIVDQGTAAAASSCPGLTRSNNSVENADPLATDRQYGRDSPPHRAIRGVTAT